jgi:hypothetical protein
MDHERTAIENSQDSHQRDVKTKPNATLHRRSRVTLWAGALRTSKRYTAIDYARAAILTALVPTTLAALLLWWVPGGCDLRGSPAVYRWTCLLPGLLLVVPVPVALLLPVAFALNHRWARLFPAGWLVTILTVGILTQAVLSFGYLLALNPAYRGLFLAEVLFIPQPFIAGVISGAVFWVALHWGKSTKHLVR